MDSCLRSGLTAVLLQGQDGGADVAKLFRRISAAGHLFPGTEEHGQNLRWIGNEDGEAPFDTWSTADQKVCHFDGKSRDELIGSGVPGGKYWFPAETDMGKPQAAGRRSRLGLGAWRGRPGMDAGGTAGNVIIPLWEKQQFPAGPMYCGRWKLS